MVIKINMFMALLSLYHFSIFRRWFMARSNVITQFLVI